MQRLWSLLFLLLLGFAALPAQASSRDKGLLYACPYLHDKARQHIAPMTQGKEGWFFRSSDFQEYYALLPDTQDFLSRLNQAFASQGTTLVLLEVPPRTLAERAFLNKKQPMQNTFNPKITHRSYYNYVESLRKTGAVVVNTLDLATQRDTKNNLNFYFKRDIHWSPFAAKITAARVAEVMKKEAGYVPDKEQKFVTTSSNKLEMKGVMYEELQQLCTDSIPAEFAPEYITTVKADDESADALFGDTSSKPPIVLLGSSFSWMSIINLEGFLAEALNREVANFSIPGGALFNAITSYISLPEDQKLAPEYVIWENLSHYDFSSGERMLRQIIPAIYNECSVEDAIATSTLAINEGKGGDLLILPEGKDIHGSDYYLFINSDNLGLTRFTLEIEYADGDGEWFTIDRTANFNNTGRFFAELTNEISSPLVKVALSGMENVKANVEVRLCKIPQTKPKKEKSV
jgi:alginate biosynthesis protein AlgX